MLTMANRKHQSVPTSMLDHRPRSCPSSPHALDPENQETVYDETVVQEYDVNTVQLPDSRQTANTQEEQDCNDNSGDGDSSSDYVNNTSDEEYDEGLPDEEEGMTYYIRYCPEDDSYLEGMDCNGEEYVHPEEHHVETDECQEAVEEEWTESKTQQQDCIDEVEGQESQMQVLEEDNSASLEVQDQEEPAQYSENEEGYQDYYPPEANGNSLPQSPFHSRKGDGDVEDQEEDIDQIVAEIKMSMSMSSLNSTTDMSPEHSGKDNVPKDLTEICHKEDTGHCASRHEGRPKSLNIPSASKHINDIPRGYKTKVRTPEERQKWSQEQQTKKVASFPSFVDVPGPCEPEDLIDGIIFAANFLGSTQLLSERNPSKNVRMMQAQEAVSRVKRMQKAAKIKKKANSEGDSPTLTEVDLFISTQSIKVLNADTQETMMDHALRTISYIADIGNIVVLMARRRMPRSASQDCIETTPGAQEGKKQYKMICHVFESEDAQLIAQSIGQAFSVAYQEFLRANGINPEDLSQKEYSDIINTQEMYNDDLIHFSNSENCKEGLKNQTQLKLNIVSCPPVTTVLIKRPDLKYQLGFSVQNGIIHMKTMPAAMFRLLTGQETPLYI
ncbi:hypothetical protein FKM82_004662 [Ascaphus truei]